MPKPTVFISYSHRDSDWVRGWLLPRLEGRGVRVIIDFRDFEFGVPSIVNMDRAVERADRVLFVLTPDWVESEWCNFEGIITQTDDPIGLRRWALPLMLRDCELPRRLRILHYADFRYEANWESELARLVDQVGAAAPPSAGFELTVSRTATGAWARGPEKVFIAKLPATSPLVLGRTDELGMLDGAWEDDGTNVVSLVAWAGVGKTALVMRWLQLMRKDHFRGAQRVYGWSFYSQGAREGAQVSADPFIAHALEWFGDPDMAQSSRSPWDKGERLAELVCRERTLLVLDGLEPLQYPPGPEGGLLKDPALACLLRQLAMRNPGLCVVTTRLAVGNLVDFTQMTVSEKELVDLPLEAAVALLRELGCGGTEAELEQTCREFGRHALALTLLGRYLATVHGGDARKRDHVAALTPLPERGGQARRVMESYERWLGGTPELAVLRVMGLFECPADPAAVEAVRAAPPIKGLTEPLADITEDQWAFALKHLRELRLLAPEDPAAPGALDCHPLVREHFADGLRQDAPAAWREAHGRLYEHYRLAAKEYPDTVEEMGPLYAAVAHGCVAGRHQEALEEVYWRRIQRGNQSFNTHNLGAFGTGLGALSNFFEQPWRRPLGSLRPGDRGYVLSGAGFYLRALGRLAEGLDPLEAALGMWIARQEWGNAAIAAANLSELCLTMGRIPDALGYAERGVELAERGVELADRTGDAYRRITARAALAGALHQAGALEEAADLFREAERMQGERQPQYPLLHSLQGYRYCDLLLAQGGWPQVVERANRALERDRAWGWLLDIGLNNLSLGRAHLLQALAEDGDFGPSQQHLDEAVAGLRRAGQQDYLVLGVLARAELFRHLSDFVKARRDLDEAMSVATRGGMRQHEADCHLEYARLLLAMGESDEARQHFVKARDMVEEMGYARRQPDIDELGRALASEGD